MLRGLIVAELRPNLAKANLSQYGPPVSPRSLRGSISVSFLCLSPLCLLSVSSLYIFPRCLLSVSSLCLSPLSLPSVSSLRLFLSSLPFVSSFRLFLPSFSTILFYLTLPSVLSVSFLCLLTLPLFSVSLSFSFSSFLGLFPLSLLSVFDSDSSLYVPVHPVTSNFVSSLYLLPLSILSCHLNFHLVSPSVFVVPLFLCLTFISFSLSFSTVVFLLSLAFVSSLCHFFVFTGVYIYGNWVKNRFLKEEK